MTEHRPSAIHGHCDDRFARIADELERNLAERGEVGASVAVAIGGEMVVDLWGGDADGARRRSWEKDTLCVMMSATKGAVALCAHLLAGTGELDFDEPVATYWPEFAAAGKKGVLVRHLLTHQAGLPALREPLPPGGMLDWDDMVRRLAAEAPFWEPGTRHGYHALTFGFLVGEVIRRVTGRSVGQFFATEVAGPLGLDFWIGLPADEHGRVAELLPAPFPGPGQAINRFVEASMTDPSSIAALIMLNNGEYMFPGNWDAPDALVAELPSSGGVGNGRSLAGLYRAIVHDRTIGRFELSDADLVRMGAVQSSASEDASLWSPGRWTFGFLKSGCSARGVEPPMRIALSEDAFGHTGAGGSLGFADPAAGMSFGYVMNQMGPDLGNTERAQALVDAAYAALGYHRSPYDGTWIA
jgi:CubicO group peptidase (beta-lactamase class C family)